MGVSPVSGATRAFAISYPQETQETVTKRTGDFNISVAQDDTVAFNTAKASDVNQNNTELKLKAPFGTLSLSGREQTKNTVTAPKRNYVFIKPC